MRRVLDGLVLARKFLLSGELLLRTALIGSGWWGKNILKEAMASGRCTVAALADPTRRADAKSS